MRASRSGASAVIDQTAGHLWKTESTNYLTESNSGCCDGRVESDEAFSPDPAQQIGFGIAAMSLMCPEFFIERAAQNQSLLGARKHRQRAAQPGPQAKNFARKNCSPRPIGCLPDKRGRLVDPAQSRHNAGPQEHQPITPRRCGCGPEPRPNYFRG